MEQCKIFVGDGESPEELETRVNEWLKTISAEKIVSRQTKVAVDRDLVTIVVVIYYKE